MQASRRAASTPSAPQLVCGVEAGWCGIRSFSLAAAREDRGVVVVIRGLLEPEVLAMITTPPQMRVVAVAPGWFRLRLAWEVVRAAWRGQLRWVVVTKARTKRLLAPLARLCRARVVQLFEAVPGYRFEAGENPLSPSVGV